MFQSIAMSSSVICFFLLPCGAISAATSISVSEMSWYRTSTHASSIFKHSKRLFNFNWNSYPFSLSRKMLNLLFFSCLINLSLPSFLFRWIMARTILWSLPMSTFVTSQFWMIPLAAENVIYLIPRISIGAFPCPISVLVFLEFATINLC